MMINKPTVSIIIPVYNVELYIEKCLTSVMHQDFKNFECLIIDDGSQDHSIEIAESIIKHDNRFKIYHKENGGLSSARNKGLKHAIGEFVTFIDSDDYIEHDLLSLTMNSLEKDESDICMFGINYVDEGYKIIKQWENTTKPNYFLNDFLITENIILNIACNKVYRRSIFKDIKFDESILSYEDAYIMPEVVYNKKISNIKKPLYNYLQRPESLSKTISDTFIEDRTKLIKKHHEFAKSIGKYDVNNSYIINSYLKAYIYHGLMKIYRYSNNKDEDLKQFKKHWKTDLYNYKNICLLMKSDPKTASLLMLFNISPLAFKKLIELRFRNRTA